MNYPGQPKRAYKKPKTASQLKMANKGKFTETYIERTNIQYKADGLADIDKIPTPTLLQYVDKKTSEIKAGKVLKGYHVDFAGVTKGGRAICFDAKECSNKTSFPLGNVEPHQYEKLKSYHYMGGHAFLIVHKKALQKCYRVPFPVLERFWEGNKNNGERASIPQEVFDNECVRIKPNVRYMLHYLEGLE